MSSEPTILKTSDDAGFLAMMPMLAGSTHRNALLVMPFTGKRTAGAARISLPTAVTRDIVDRLLSTSIGILSRVPACDGVAVVLCTDEAFVPAREKWSALFERFDQRLEDAGFRMHGIFCIAADGWANWYDPSTPAQGRPLSDIEQNPVAQQVSRVRGDTPLRDYDADAVLPAPDESLAGEVIGILDDLLEDGVERTAFGSTRPARLPDPKDLVEDLLAKELADVSAASLAHLVAFCNRPDRRDQITVQIAFGREEALKVEADTARWHALQAETGLSMDEVILREYESGRISRDDENLLFGVTERMPDRTRLRSAVGLLRHAIAHSPVEDRPGALCVLAWLCWALGLNTAADRHAHAALAIDPTLRMAAMYAQVIDAGYMPDWIYKAQSLEYRLSPATAPRSTSRERKPRATRKR